MSLRDQILALPLPTPDELTESVFGYTEDHLNGIKAAAAALVTSAVASGAMKDPCAICGADEPRTGTCGSSDARALCNMPAVDQKLLAHSGFAVGTLSVFDDKEATFGFAYDISANAAGHRRLQLLDGATLYVGRAQNDELRNALQALLDNPAPGQMMGGDAFDAALDKHLSAKEVARAALANADALAALQLESHG